MGFNFPNELKVDDEINLVVLSLADAKDLHTLILRNHAYLSKYLAWAEKISDLASTEDFIRLRVAVPGLISGWYKVYVNNQLCGIFGAKSVIDNRAELGCFIAEDYQGQGIINRCMLFFTEYLSREFQVSMIEWRCLADNKASIKVVERFGAVLDDVEVGTIAGSDEMQRLCVYRKQIAKV
ncbi:GNAT family N-acetyltransferase [Aliamphritea ceti]|uniref:GNAT family N-acetyltransferase n=1 Tax=Aliamphritea ceti TaxID=1524258 RepID=UPI0021C30244|nr:GNAT family protein [Aliamphritea ceti]